MSFLASTAFAAEIKEADLAGSWYPKSKAELENLLQGYLDSASPEKVNGQMLVIISPHAGYQFSGPIAAYGFKAARDQNVSTIIVIGFSHRKYFGGISVYDTGGFRTPLGEIQIDTELAKAIIGRNKRISFNPGLFDGENSVEMQIPFIQMVFKKAKIVPIEFGAQDYGDAVILSDALAEVLKKRTDCLIVASTDMSHYHPYAEANSIDQHTISLINKMRAKDLYDEAAMRSCELCGIMPVTAALLTAERLGFDKIKVLRYANSGDTAGNKKSVVGYVSAAVYKESVKRKAQSAKLNEKVKGERQMLNEKQRKRLLEVARKSISSFVNDGKRERFTEADPVLNESMGAFVTLHENGELRGCIGNMVGQGPLYQTVADMAIGAATGDPRFQRLSPKEINNIDIEISVLSPLKKVLRPEEIKIPGHGVIVRSGFRSGVYLPQVATETGWTKEEFLTSLCAHKAGISPNAWKDPATEMYVFTAEVFGERIEHRNTGAQEHK